MRLIRLRVRNIASLKGEHEVDFELIQKESPLFAITGETGSGKSTILNCIGLALYGQIYKKNVNQPDVVTLGEKEGSIELIFQVKGKFYLADWRIRVRKQNGDAYSVAPTAVRNLYTIEGSEFSDAKTVTTTNATELLNLDFDQFCKCIILNQGEFARFLTSSFNDRKEILEKLYPGELLDNISRELDQEKKSLEKHKHDLEIELHTLKGDNIPGENLKSDKQRLEKELAKLEETFRHVEKVDYHFVSLESYFDKYLQNEARKSQIKEEIKNETTKFNLLLKTGEEIHESYQSARKKLETEVPVLQAFLEKENTLRHLEENWTSLKVKSTALTQSVKETQEKITARTHEEGSSQKKLSDLAGLLKLPVSELKSSREKIEELFDLYNETELLGSEIKGKKEKLSELEVKGTELTAEITRITAEMEKLPQNAEEKEAEILRAKKDIQDKTEKKQRAVIASQELTRQLEASKAEILSVEEKISALNILIARTKDDIFPLETTLKLQEVLNATEVCIDHALTAGNDRCPVCESPVAGSRWSDLKQKLAATDLKVIRKKFEEGTQLIVKSSQEIEYSTSRIMKEKEVLLEREKQLASFRELLNLAIPEASSLDKELETVRKDALQFTQFKKDLEGKTFERDKLRAQFKTVREDLNSRETVYNGKNQKFLSLTESLKHLVPLVDRDTVRELKNELKIVVQYQEEESHFDKITREKTFLSEKKTDFLKELETVEKSLADHEARISEIRSDLEKELKGEKASVLIQKINDLVKTTADHWAKHLEQQNKQEQLLKGAQGRLYTYDEQTKEIDLLFTKELHTLRELGHFPVESLQFLKTLELGFHSQKELFLPLKDLIRSEKDQYKKAANETREQFARISEKLSAWEKLQDKIQLLEIKAKEVQTALDRKLRLFEVLGKDELRTFVLSLVEEGLIHQTNEELQKLCQGRYEIVHQTKSMKMTPEFFILDKFREGGRRKVSTLSGGETFMVSIAMALGLAEMTRGQAEIDSLFIDEGFGTLDQDSLEDVLDMLQQIQTRGLMVGIISHIKPLTTALPVNLLLNKKSDGTSTITVQHN